MNNTDKGFVQIVSIPEIEMTLTHRLVEDDGLLDGGAITKAEHEFLQAFLKLQALLPKLPPLVRGTKGEE
jgi:hypothetical protein